MRAVNARGPGHASTTPRLSREVAPRPICAARQLLLRFGRAPPRIPPMLRLFHVLWLAVPAAMLGGCPVYADGCVSNDDCDYGYFCDYPSGTCQKVDTQPTEGGTPRCR